MQYTSSTLANEVRDVLKLQVGRDKFPSVLPVIDVNPKHARVINKLIASSSVTTGTTTVYTTPTDRDFYLYGISIGYSKDAVCDQATGTINVQCTPASTSTAVTIFALPLLTLTAQQFMNQVSFDIPILLARGTNVTFGNASFTVGLQSRSCCLQGLIVDNSGA